MKRLITQFSPASIQFITIHAPCEEKQEIFNITEGVNYSSRTIEPKWLDVSRTLLLALSDLLKSKCLCCESHVFVCTDHPAFVVVSLIVSSLRVEVVELLICIRLMCGPAGRPSVSCSGCSAQQLAELSTSPSGYEASVSVSNPPDRAQSNRKERPSHSCI